MIRVFSDIENKVQQLKEYLLYIFEEKKTDTVSGESKSFPYYQLRAERFFPKNETNKSAYSVVLDLLFEAVTSSLSDLRDEKKARWNIYQGYMGILSS